MTAASRPGGPLESHPFLIARNRAYGRRFILLFAAPAAQILSASLNKVRVVE
jgi:hypothetical protein